MNITNFSKNIIFIIWGIVFVISLFRWYIFLSSSQYKRISFILPHFIIAPEKLDTIRSQITQDIETQEPTIIIISPDHFNTYRTNNLIYDTSINNVCVQWYCQIAQWSWITPQSSSYTITNHTLILPDHGIWAHLRFIKKRLPKAKIIPLLLQPRSIENSKALINTIQSISRQQPTIVIWSVDRSHYVPEPWAKLHDITTRSILSSHDTDRNNRKKLDVDCPSCLWIVDQIAQYDNYVPKLLWRDSSAILFWTTGSDNTSRWIISYVPIEKDTINNASWIFTSQSLLETWVTLLMWWDLIYDRWVKKKLPDYSSLSRHFYEWYQQYDISQNLLFSFHRKWAGIDIVALNLETPLYQNWTICYPQNKPYSFCSNESILDVLSAIGFNTISFANNHRFDAGTNQYNITKSIIKNNNMDVMSEDEIIKKNIRWILVALHAYDFTVIDTKNILQKSCSNIQQSTQEWYIPIISVHRWEEYKQSITAQQKIIAQELIKCWAKAIIWHHPHVIGSIEWINNVPVIYSLWNFLMDQWFSAETTTGMLVGLVIPQSWLIQLFTWLVNSTP